MYSDEQRYFHEAPLQGAPRAEVIDELWHSVREGKPLVHSTRWGHATTEVCPNILESARTGSAMLRCSFTFSHSLKGGFSDGFFE